MSAASKEWQETVQTFQELRGAAIAELDLLLKSAGQGRKRQKLKRGPATEDEVSHNGEPDESLEYAESNSSPGAYEYPCSLHHDELGS